MRFRIEGVEVGMIKRQAFAWILWTEVRSASVVGKSRTTDESENASCGEGWVSMKRAWTPAVTARLARRGARSGRPAVEVPWPPGCCVECVTSKHTG